MVNEELYIIMDGIRERLDLKTPSGITLSYESNLFNTLDKVICSRSYTFNLPRTNNNTRILGMLEDIRATGARIGERYKAEFIANGVNLCPNANIYISEFKGTYSAVMTWGVIEGLKDLQSAKVNISQLESESESTTIDNNSIVVTPKENSGYAEEVSFTAPMFPFYEAGVPKDSANYPRTGLIVPIFKAYALPVVPVLMLLQRINQKFGTKILQKNDGTYYTDDVIQKGVVPDVKVQLTPTQSKLLTSTFTLPTCNERGIVSFGNKADGSHGQYKTDFLTFGTVSPNNYSDMSFIIEGNLKVNPAYVTTAAKKPVYLCVSRGISGSPTISNDWENDIRVESEFNTVEGQKVYTYEWNMIEALGTAIEIKYSLSDYMNPINFHFENEDGETCASVTFSVAQPLTQYLSIYPRWNEGNAPHLMDSISSLPDIGCFEFVKSLFYMIGAFPTTGENGNIIPAYYKDLIDNVTNGNVYNWSGKVINEKDNPKSVDWRVGDFAQNNLYRMKSDDDSQSRGLTDDRYKDGVANVIVNNGLLEDEKTVVTLPFYAPFTHHGKRPALATGETMKYWSVDDDGRLIASEANPIFGLVDATPQTTGYYEVMRCFNFPDDVDLDALQKIVGNPRVITVELNIDEYALTNLSFIKPVYLEQYCSYFAIIKIQRASSGICTAELIKIDL